MRTYNHFTLVDLIGTSGITKELRRMEEAQQSWAKMLNPIGSIGAMARDLLESNSLASQAVKHLHELERQKSESIAKMLNLLADIRNSLMPDSGIKGLLADLARPKQLSEEFSEMANVASSYSIAMEAMQGSIQASLAHAEKTFAANAIADSFVQVMKSFQEEHKRWTVPAELIDSVGALKAMQNQIGSLSLPVIDWASAAALTRVLGREGIAAQLAALGISLDGTLSPEALQGEEQGIGLNRKSMELLTLLGFILTILFFIYQEQSSGKWQQHVDSKFDAQQNTLEAQAKQLEALSTLVEKALVKEAKRSDTRFVVLDRVTTVRSKPQHGATVTGKLLPREVVKLVAEQGKWIEFEYYHWLRQEYQMGWALKKYLERVPLSRKAS